MKYPLPLLVLVSLLATPAVSTAQDVIKVDTTAVVADVSRRPLGINMNFLLDDDEQRVQALESLASALKNAGVKYLRYPGGEKSDAYLWSVPPYDRSIPTLARWAAGEYPQNQEWPSYDRHLVETDGRTFKKSPLDFDEFMALCREIGCEPTIVVCYDSMYKAAQRGGVAPTRAQLLETAREWVRYANITKGYKVKYWEIGNETWLPHYNGGTTAENYARDLIEFSRVMKAVDPTIRIGANGESDAWWRTILSSASSSIDFLAVHNYPAWNWGSFAYYQNNTINLLGPISIAQNAINTHAPPADRARLKIAATEVNSADWSGSWPHVNDLGHAIALFDTLGTHLRHPNVEFSQLWNTRWSGNDTTQIPALWDALDKNNALQATGRATAIWGQFLKDTLVSSTSTTKVRTYATFSPGSGKVSVFLINKDNVSRPVTVSINADGFLLDTWAFSGTGAQDLSPTWTHQNRSWNGGSLVAVTLAPVSITVLDMTPDTRVHDIPGVIQAEDFRDDGYWDSTSGNAGGAYRTGDVDIQPTTDSGGGFNVGWIAAGEWMEYTIRVPKDGHYDLSVRLASPYAGRSLRLLLNGQDSGRIDVPNTGGWQAWRTVTRSVFLTAGVHRLAVVANTSGFNLNWLSLLAAAAPAPTMPVLVQAEDFLEGSYWDSTPGNAGGTYRQTDVDIQPTTDIGGGFNVGWITAGEWLEYVVHVPASGLYDLGLRVAAASAGRTLDISVDGGFVGTLPVPNTGSHQKWQTITRPRLTMTAGTHRVRIATSTGRFNLNWLSLTPTQ